MVSPFRVNHNLGPNLHQVVKANQVWYEGAEQIGSPQLGDVSQGDDGGRYIWVEATGAIAVASPATAVIVAFTGPDNVTAATGAGDYTAPSSDYYEGTIAAGDRFWAKQVFA